MSKGLKNRYIILQLFYSPTAAWKCDKASEYCPLVSICIPRLRCWSISACVAHSTPVQRKFRWHMQVLENMQISTIITYMKLGSRKRLGRRSVQPFFASTLWRTRHFAKQSFLNELCELFFIKTHDFISFLTHIISTFDFCRK